MNTKQSPNTIALLADLISPQLKTDEVLGKYQLTDIDLDLAFTEGVYPLLCDRLKDLDQEKRPISSDEQNTFEQLCAHNRHAMATELIYTDLLTESLDSLKSYNPVLLKGITLAYTDYAKPHLRPMADVDLLIPKQSINEAKITLSAEGFEHLNSAFSDLVLPQFMSSKTQSGTTLMLDVHGHTFNGAALQDLLPYNEVYANAATIDIQGYPCLAPSRAHRLIHACLHLAAHHRNSQKLIWLYDIWLLINHCDDSDRSAVLEYTQEKRIALTMLDAISNCHGFFPIPNLSLMDKLTRLGEQQKSSPHPATRMLRSTSNRERTIEDWKSIIGLKNKLIWIKEYLFPDYQYIQSKYGVSSFPMVIGAYIWRIFSGIIRIFRLKS